MFCNFRVGKLQNNGKPIINDNNEPDIDDTDRIQCE